LRVLLLGGSGFIGSHMVDVLLESGFEITVFDRSQERYRKCPAEVSYVRGDLGHRGELEEILASGVDAVVHLISSTTPKTSNDDPIFDVQMNLVESIALLDSCVKHKVGKVIFISSGGTVYGVPEHLPIREEHPTNPICSYGVVKLTIEKYLTLYRQLYGLKSAILRVSNPYGTRQDPWSMQGAISVFMGKMLRDEPIHIWGDGSVVRDFIHVRDIAKLCELAIVGEAEGIYNAGSGKGTSLDELIRMIGKELDVAPQVVKQGGRPFDVPSVILDCEKAKRTFGWEPAIPFPEGLSELAEWQKSYFNGDFKRAKATTR
jgi:UDP-glucose 4-epimerase